MNPTANNINPNPALGSIVASLPLSPARKLAGLLALHPALARGTQAEMAEALGRDKVHLNMVISGKRASQSLRREIAGFLGVAEGDIWPPEAEDASLPPSLPGRASGHNQNASGGVR